MSRTSRTPHTTPPAGTPHAPLPRDVHPVLRRSATPPAALELLAQAQFLLEEAAGAPHPNDRYVAAHLAALRTAAAVLAARTPAVPPARRARPGARARPVRRGIRSAWEALPEVAPELAEWSAYFAAGARRRALAEAGVRDAAGEAQAAELLRAADVFLRLVERTLVDQPALPHPRAVGEEAG